MTFTHPGEIMASVDNILNLVNVVDVALPPIVLRRFRKMAPAVYVVLVDYLRKKNQKVANFITVSALHNDMLTNLASSHPLVNKITMRRLQQVIQFGNDIHAHCIALQLGRRGLFSQEKESRQNLLRNLTTLALQTRELNTPICFENSAPMNSRSLLLTVQEHQQFFNHFGFGVALNLAFVQALNLEEAALLEYLSALLPITQVIYFNKATPGKHPHEYKNHDTSYHFEKLLALIKFLGYQGPAIVDSLPHPLIPRAFQALAIEALDELLK